jgi:hypothetical protein
VSRIQNYSLTYQRPQFRYTNRLFDHIERTQRHGFDGQRDSRIAADHREGSNDVDSYAPSKFPSIL